MRLLVRSSLRVIFEIETVAGDIKVISVSTDAMKKDLDEWLQYGFNERIKDEKSGHSFSRHTEPSHSEFLPRLGNYAARYGFTYYLKD